MDRFEKLALALAILAMASVASDRSRRAHGYYLGRTDSGGMWIWVAGWMTASYARLAVLARSRCR